MKFLEWGNIGEVHPDVVWAAKLDNRFQVEVQRTSDYTADLIVFDRNVEFEEIFQVTVTLNYGAQFGPDQGDIDEWRTMVADYIDDEYLLYE